MVAAFRAWGAREWPEVASDPWAAALGGPDGADDAERYAAIHPVMPLYMALRTRAIDDEVRAAIDAGARQVVILGAGLDTRAARLATPGVRFFEVDQPASQSDKAARLLTASYPASVARYVACDFERDDFAERLASAGLDPAAPAVFVWEGVVYYLTEPAVRATLTKIASGAPQTRVVLDVVGKRFVQGGLTGDDDLARTRVAEMGEPLRFGIDDPLPLLYECGFRSVRVRSFDELALRYTGTYERSRKMRFQQLVVAGVGPA